MKLFAVRVRGVAISCLAVLLALCAACGGGGSGGDGGGGGSTTPPPTGSTDIGASGGTVSEASGAKVVVPAGALSANTPIAVTQSSAGAPPLPAGVTAAGEIYAFTPHGTTFAVPATITVPFDPARVPAGAVLVLYKTNATQTAWIAVPGATVSGNTMSGSVTGFSFAVVAPQPPEGFPELTEKSWRISAFGFAAGPIVPPLDVGQQTGGELERAHAVGEDLPIHPPTQPDPPTAQLIAFSSANGKTFWTTAQAPRSLPDDPAPIDTSSVELKQTYTFKVRDPNASLKFVITRAVVELVDDGGNGPGIATCPWLDPTLPSAQIESNCAENMMWAQNLIYISARGVQSQDNFYDTNALMALIGSAGHFQFASGPDGDGSLFHDADFDIVLDATHAFADDHASAELKAPKVVEIPLSSLHVNDVFDVVVDLTSYARNLVQGESYAVASLRDPVDFNTAISIESSGLEQLPVNHDPIPAQVPVACASPDSAAGQFELGAADYSSPENPLPVRVEIRRVGGTHGEAKVLLETADGTAVAGSDYEAQHIVLRFGDGEGGSKFVDIPLVVDQVAEPDESAQIKLTPFSGCATLGARASATLTIQDDDRPLPQPDTHTISGTVTGLTGSGLVLRNVLTGISVNATNGPFTLPEALIDGTHYDVRVDTQPTNPVQQCTVTNGSGVIAGADITNVQVTCTVFAPAGGLDPTFGTAGRVVTTIPFSTSVFNARLGMAMQSDGRILLVGGLALVRFNADGTLDASFGTGGHVQVPFNGGTFDGAQDVAVQPDGKIVVVGVTDPGAQFGKEDFAVARFNADGTLDTSFGSGGKTSTDIAGSTDVARRVRIQPDGKILVAGEAIIVASPTVAVQDFALVRYNSDGTLDASFSLSGGKVFDSPGRSFNILNGLALQSDGKVVLAGPTADNGAAAPFEAGLIRYSANGQRDATFGALGNGTVDSNLQLATSSQVDDVLVMPDGTVFVAGESAVAGSTQFVLAAFSSDGRLASGAGLTKFSDQNDVARSMLLQADGKIVVVGQSASIGTNPDMAIVRYAGSGSAFGPDASFGNQGKVTIDFFGGKDNAIGVVQQPDGKLVVGGLVQNGAGIVFALARLMP